MARDKFFDKILFADRDPNPSDPNPDPSDPNPDPSDLNPDPSSRMFLGLLDPDPNPLVRAEWRIRDVYPGSKQK